MKLFRSKVTLEDSFHFKINSLYHECALCLRLILFSVFLDKIIQKLHFSWNAMKLLTEAETLWCVHVTLKRYRQKGTIFLCSLVSACKSVNELNFWSADCFCMYDLAHTFPLVHVNILFYYKQLQRPQSCCGDVECVQLPLRAGYKPA